MKLNSLPRATAFGAAALTVALGMSACSASNEDSSDGDTSSTGGPSVSGDLNGAGATSQEAAMAAWKAGFQGSNPDVTVNYDAVGSGGGREQFLAGGVLFAGSDSANDRRRAQAGPGHVLRRRDRVPGLRQPDRGDLQRRRCRRPAALPRHPDPDLRRQDHVVGRPGHSGRQPRRRPAEHRHHAGAPFGRVGYDVQLHRLHVADRPGGLVLRARRRLADQERGSRRRHLGRRVHREGWRRHHRLRRREPGR